MGFSGFIPRVVTLLAMLAGGLMAPGGAAATPAGAAAGLDNAACLTCHAAGKPKIEVPGADDEKRPLAAVDPGKHAKSVHAKMQCVACHTEIVDSQAQHHKVAGAKAPDCATCHLQLWDEAKKNNQTKDKERLGVVVLNVEAYKQSFHARPDTDHPERPKAACADCHATHDFAVPPRALRSGSNGA